MNYYAARQRQNASIWDYTCRNDDNIYPIGYCRPFSDPAEHNPLGIAVNSEDLRELRANAHKHHDHGHHTESDAQNCYREYLLDHHVRLGGKHSRVAYPCEVCGVMTSLYASVQMKYWSLCEEHNNKTEVANLLPIPGTTISSY